MKKKKSRRQNQTQPIELKNETPQRTAPDPLEAQSWAAATKSLPLTKWTLFVTVLGTLAAIAAIVIPIAMDKGKTADATPIQNEKTIAVTEVKEASPVPAPVVSQNSSVVEPKETSRTDQPQENNAARNSAGTHVIKAQTLYHQRNYKQAIAECDEALRVDPRNKAARTLKARIERTVQILTENDRSTP